jgi:hypothetical protein
MNMRRAAHKYDGLKDLLTKHAGRAAYMDFGTVEVLIGARLPPSARKLPEWWANHPSLASKGRQRYAWLEAGWLVDRALLNDELVYFKRRPNRQRKESS